MASVGIVVHHTRPSAAALAERTATWLEDSGHDVRVLGDDARATGLERWAADEDALRGSDVMVSLGGDGTMLRTIELVAPTDTPVIGVNLGHLGYLTEVDPTSLQDALTRFFDGDYAIEERMLLDVGVSRAGVGDPSHHTAMNEAVLEKTLSGHTVRLAVHFDGEFFTSYATDGLIIATPTGSTAYAFSARGPIIAPTHRAILVTPVSPHMLFDRSLVLEPTTSVRIVVEGPLAAALTVDGRLVGELEPGDEVSCTASPHRARLVMYGTRDFHRILKRKFGLNDR